MGPELLASTPDAVVGLFVAVPIVVVAGGVAVGLRLRGRGKKDHVPAGEVASDATTDIELDRSADANRQATLEETPSVRTAVAEPAPAPAEPAEPEPEPAEPPTYRSRLGKARGLLSGYLGAVRSKGRIDAATWDDLEEALIRADVGVGATDALLDGLRTGVKDGEIVGPDALVDALKSELVSMLTSADSSLAVPGSAPAVGQDEDARPVDVWLFVGVNGVGKTTTVGKVASRLSRSGTKVLLAAGDTFRAAAGEQLSLWASRADAEIVRGSEGGDPSSVVFDAVQRASSRGTRWCWPTRPGASTTKSISSRS